MEQNFTGQDSLRIINEMIGHARNNFRKGAANSSIFCGYFVACTALLNFILIYTLDNPLQSFWVWMLMFPMAVIANFIDYKRKKEEVVKTHIDAIVSAIWIAFPISVAIFLAVVFVTAYAIKSSYLGIVITPTLLIMMGAAQYTTAIATRYRPYIYGAAVFWTGALLCGVAYLLGYPNFQFILLAVCAVAGLSVPGHMLNKKAEKDV
ncbi:hypothetical protein [Dysgonomonas sp. 511]|uniref:hypothetical protein n=1 Tax=Dysgonomonas sp. 511 TaxID=2302930 RepID=UPI0013D765D9|nr:hypothetical protein [Dysgonomonas sp. 511]NDV77513.1 hypothetical protein [Dysgonomonas sp. 511]